MYELAYNLHMPVYRLIDEMPYAELMGWLDYFERRPVGSAEDSRIMKILQAMGIKAKPEELFSTLAQVSKMRSKDTMQGLTGSFLFKKMLEATGGDSLPFLKEQVND